MSDDRPPAPMYGPPITIPSAYTLGVAAYNAWCAAHLDDPAVSRTELSQAERVMWQRIATKVAGLIRDATDGSHALGNYLPPPRCPAQRRDRSTDTLYICCRWDPHPADHPQVRWSTTKATAGCRSSRELAAAALARVLQGLHPKQTSAARVFCARSTGLSPLPAA
jgi:hypothetical protein